MTPKENKLAIQMLKLASNAFSNYGCNDVDESVYKDWTKQERIDFVKQFHEYNGNPEDFDSEKLDIPDWLLMDFMAYKLTKSI